MVGANEVDGNFILVAELKKVADPGVHCSCRSAHSNLLVNCLDRFRSMAIECEVVALVAAPKSFEIRFVPHFKEPLPDFAQTIALNPMRDQCADQCCPLSIVARHRHVSAIVKDGFIA